jgi:hypothetical protein
MDQARLHPEDRPAEVARSDEEALDEVLLGVARLMTGRELRLRAAVGNDFATDVEREEHLDCVRRALRERGC